MSDATRARGYSPDSLPLTLQATMAAYRLFQQPDGRAAALIRDTGGSSGQSIIPVSKGVVTCPKVTGVKFLDGGRAFWDFSASNATYKPVDDRDFYAGTIVGDAEEAAATFTLNLNEVPRYDTDLLRDPYTTGPTGTQALGGFLPPQRNGGCLTMLLSSTNQVQMVDALSKDGFAAGGGCGIVEAVWNVISAGAAGAPDFSIGIASATHATDADSIAQHLLCHLNGNDTKIYFQSKDGTNTTTAQDSLAVFAAGAGNTNRVEVWFDLRSMASVKVYVNGARVLSGQTFNLSAAALRWLLLAHLEKTSSADTFQIDVERLVVRKALQRG